MSSGAVIIALLNTACFLTSAYLRLLWVNSRSFLVTLMTCIY